MDAVRGYLESGRFALELAQLWPDGERVKPHKKRMSREAFAATLGRLDPADAAALRSLYDLFESGEMPVCADADPALGYSLRDDLKGDYGSCFGEDTQAMERGEHAVGLADDGGGLRCFAVPGGGVHILDMGEMPFCWQLPSFDSVDLWWWCMFHAHLAREGVIDASAFLREVDELGCKTALEAWVLDLASLGSAD